MKPKKEFAACENCDASIDASQKPLKPGVIFIEKGTISVPLTQGSGEEVATYQDRDISGYYDRGVCLTRQLRSLMPRKVKGAKKAAKKKATKKRERPAPDQPQTQ